MTRRTGLYIATVVLAAVGLAVAMQVHASAPSLQDVLLGLIFSGLMVLAMRYPLDFGPQMKVHLGPSVTIATILLFPSGLAMLIVGLGVFAAERGDVFGLRRWYLVTLVMGAVFVAGQANEYRNLVHEGIKLNGDGYGSMFYLTTGFHGLHVTGGLIAFIVYMIRTTMGRFTPAQATSAIVVSYYWHFVDIVWIALFAMIYWLQ
jgi:heme/copper-type cytochrome/quinol oxidase subunit 3